jgi:hypothetical protein
MLGQTHYLDSIELVKKLEGMQAVITPTLWTDYYHPENSVTTDRMNKLQWKLYYLSWKTDMKAIDQWIWYGTSSFPPVVRHLATAFGKLGTRHQLRVIRDRARKVLGEDPDFDAV